MDRTLRHLRRIVVHEDLAPAPVAAEAAKANGDGKSGPPEAQASGSSSTTVGNRELVDVLLGSTGPTWLKAVPPSFDQIKAGEEIVEKGVKWYGDRLNDSQKEAIGFCLKAEQVACIHGPPGVSSVRYLFLCLLANKDHHGRITLTL